MPKIVSKKLVKTGMDEKSAAELFDTIEKFAGYGFNKSHAISYTLISYMTMWLKVYHPEAFFAACLTILGDEKLQGLAKDAQEHGIYIVPPDINASSDRFEPGYDKLRGQKILYAPFQSIKGLSEAGARAILEAKAAHGKPFATRTEFLAAVNKRVVNVRIQSALEKVGAFASIEPGTLDPRHPDRLRDQKELLPGIVLSNVKADREITVDAKVAHELATISADCASCSACPLAGFPHPSPSCGKKPKMMIITDMPNWKEEERQVMGAGDGGKILKAALEANGFKLSDVYLTSLVKARKPKEMDFENSMINGCSGFLKREIEALNPPVIVALGSKAIRHLLPEVKGGWEELCGKSHYLPAHDTTIVCGMNPMMVFFDESKQKVLDEVFAQVAEIFA